MTKRQHYFCIKYVECRNPQEASIRAGYSKAYSLTKSYNLLKKPEVKELISTLTDDHYKNHFQEIATKAIKKLSEVVQDSENRSSQLQAIKYVLSEAGVAEQDEKQAGVVSIKITLPKGLE